VAQLRAMAARYLAMRRHVQGEEEPHTGNIDRSGKRR